MMNLATAYLELIQGNRAQNIEDAIDTCEQSLRVMTRDTMPIDWARTVNNLALAYVLRIKGNPAQNTEKAINSCKQALEIFQPAKLLVDCRKTARLLGNLYTEQQRWPDAVEAYQTALQATELLYQTSIFRSSQEAELAATGDLFHRAAYAQAQTGDLESAVVTLERGRARSLSNTLERTRTDLAQVATLSPQLSRDYQSTAEALHRLEADELSANFSEDELRQRANTIRDRFRVAIEGIRTLEGYEDFLTQPDMKDIAAAMRPDRPLVYLVTTPSGSLALIVRTAKANAESHLASCIHPIWLSPLFDYSSLIRPLRGLQDERDGWVKAYHHRRLNQDIWLQNIDQFTRRLWDLLMGPVINQLETWGLEQAVLIPTGYLSFLPLHAAWTENGNSTTERRYALDTIAFTYTPNAISLKNAQDVAERISIHSLLTISNPEPTPPPPPPPRCSRVKQFKI